jgi:hypothetical protein
MECRLVYSTVPYQGNFEEQALVYVKRLLCHQKAARWKKEKSRRVRPSTVCLKKEGGQIKRPKWARTTCQTH